VHRRRHGHRYGCRGRCLRTVSASCPRCSTRLCRTRAPISLVNVVALMAWTAS
jgi:hypothetical protein